jgi:hypothetical protein
MWIMLLARSLLLLVIIASDLQLNAVDAALQDTGKF